MKKTIDNKNIETARTLLDTAYHDLGFQDGNLLMTSLVPKAGTKEVDMWLEKGDWLAQAWRINAESIFFVDNDPVIVFCQLQDNNIENIIETFRQAWCLARPQFLFVASPGELKVYSLNQYPARTIEEWDNIQPLEVVKRSVEVSQKLQEYRREQVESGQSFSYKDIGSIESRADKRLIADLREVRQLLLNINLKINQHHIHALIGRSIFVRYLEDRGVLTYEYFQKIAQNRSHTNWSSNWLRMLDEPERMDIAPNANRRYYTRVLRDKDFTYALFYQLAEHFNGDMFPQNYNEQVSITQKHLNLLRGFLLGDIDQVQAKLFLWAYDFEIIPIELISSIYEEFYHKTEDRNSGTHYTPSVLVEYTLSQLLTKRRLATNPKILDLACGSAIFLVQAFKRIVRYQEGRLGRPLSGEELQKILSEQITGVEINSDAVYVAAFSLYLALLNYQEPKDILAQIEKNHGKKPLPHIIFDPMHIKKDKDYFPVIHHENAFSLTNEERNIIESKLVEKPRFKGRVNFADLVKSDKQLSLPLNSFDIVVGNPPWGYVSESDLPDLQIDQESALKWCKAFGWSIGDKELSQAFIARATSLLKPNGDCGLLISTGVFLKRHDKSREFRKRWLSESKIKTVVNFSHVREVFFSGAISPFCFIHFQLGKVDYSHKIDYWSAKRIRAVDKIQSVTLNLSDIHKVQQHQLINDDRLWKTYWWGSQHDANLIKALGVEESLGDISKNRGWINGQGYTPGKAMSRGWLSKYKELPIDKFNRYGLVKADDLVSVPLQVHRMGIRKLYDGWRLLVKRGITQANNANGVIEARLENKSYCFRNSIHAIKLDKAAIWERKILTGILWSSLARYYFFMTTSSWGTWHHEIHLEDGLLNLPIRFPSNVNLRKQIISVVDKLSALKLSNRNLFNLDSPSEYQQAEKKLLLERQLDSLVFDLYELTQAERDLIRDLCDTGLEFFYRGNNSKAISRNTIAPITHGTMKNLRSVNDVNILGYVKTFLERWNSELKRIDGELYWQIVHSPSTPMLAIVFTTTKIGIDNHKVDHSNDLEWAVLLRKLDKTMVTPVSPRIYIDGLLRAVTDTNIIIIKRDEQRLWTRSQAREDVDATLFQAMFMKENISK